MKKLVSIIIPAYNEQDNIVELYKQLKESLALCTSIDYELIFVNDGSRDNTAFVIKSLIDQDSKVKLVNFARNFGHEIAMTAGLDYASGEAAIFMDADLQHPPSLVPQMIEKWLQGYEVVLTKIIHTEGKSLIRRALSSFFYRGINMVSDVVIPEKMPDFRLVGKKYITVLKDMRENSRMFRGMLNWLGMFNVATLDFVAPKRYTGKSNYNFIKSAKLAFDSILQFSIKPLRLSIYFGIIAAIVAFVFGMWTIYEHYALGQPSGYATIICLIGFLSSVQFIILGIIGEYVGRIHIESKNRPLYFAELIVSKKS